jgi:hypothetical protein
VVEVVLLVEEVDVVLVVEEVEEVDDVDVVLLVLLVLDVEEVDDVEVVLVVLEVELVVVVLVVVVVRCSVMHRRALSMAGLRLLPLKTKATVMGWPTCAEPYSTSYSTNLSTKALVVSVDASTT